MIDGTTQPANGYGGSAPKIEIEAQCGSCFGPGLQVQASGFGLKGVKIYNSYEEGLHIDGDGSDNFDIDGCTFGDTQYGEAIRVTGGDNGTIQNCAIGTNYNGTACLSDNQYNGITLESGSNNNSILNNYISCNFTGVEIIGCTGINIEGNAIGTNADATGCLNNDGDGIHMESSSDNCSILNNHITCNNSDAISHDDSDGTIIQGNVIGPLSNGSCDGNTYSAISIRSSSNMIIGGLDPGEGNTLAHNEFAGIEIFHSSSQSNTISGNNIYCNGYGGISVYANTYATPTITSANGTTVSGTANANDTVEVYQAHDYGCGPSGNDDEGYDFLGWTTADGSGNWSISGTFEDSVTALARPASASTSNSSEFCTSANTGVPGSMGSSGCDVTPLPVELIKFEATPNNGKVLLEWATASEQHNDHFRVERSANNGRSFEPIGTIAGYGTSSSRQNYTYTDQTPLTGISYYRLVQVDLDGAEHQLPTRAVEFGTSRHPILEVYPNPSPYGPVKIRTSGWKAPVEVRIFDNRGRQVRHTSLPAGEQQVTTAPLQSGLYLLHYQSGKNSGSRKLVIEE